MSEIVYFFIKIVFLIKFQTGKISQIFVENDCVNRIKVGQKDMSFLNNF